MIRRTAPLAALAVVSALTVTGCGVQTGPDVVAGDRQAASARLVRERQDSAAAQDRRASLPSRPPGVLTVSMRRREVMIDRAIDRLEAAGSMATFRRVVAPTDSAFEDLCAGRIDLLQSARRITSAELAQCEANGLQVRDPVIVGYATAILVTRNGSDVGGDCLTLEGVRSLLGRGSQVRNWNQIGFADKRFAAAGPPFPNGVMQAVGHLALDRPVGSVGADDFRADLVVTSNVEKIEEFVAGDDRLTALDRETRAYERRVAAQRSADTAAAIRRAERAAAAKVVKQIEAENRRRVREQQSVADPAALAASNARRVEKAKREARQPLLRADRRVVTQAGITYRREHLDAALADGRLGIVSYPFYEAHSDVLRPLEVDPRRRSSTSRKPDCRFPSQQTIASGAYPLTLPIYIYGDSGTLRSQTGRVMLRELVNHNAGLSRANDVAGLSAAALRKIRVRFGLLNAATPTPAPTTTTPKAPPVAAPSGVPGVDAPQSQP